jgi:CRISPR/Cas system CMR subunit Cmr6 (Cas7 group RAMP superfamily)
LSGEYEALMKENAHLNEMKKTVKNKAAADQYNESVRKLNAKLQEHDRKRKEFFSDVENYNARVGQENKARQKSKSTTP